MMIVKIINSAKHARSLKENRKKLYESTAHRTVSFPKSFDHYVLIFKKKFFNLFFDGGVRKKKCSPLFFFSPRERKKSETLKCTALV